MAPDLARVMVLMVPSMSSGEIEKSSFTLSLVHRRSLVIVLI